MTSTLPPPGMVVVPDTAQNSQVTVVPAVGAAGPFGHRGGRRADGGEGRDGHRDAEPDGEPRLVLDV